MIRSVCWSTERDRKPKRAEEDGGGILILLLLLLDTDFQMFFYFVFNIFLLQLSDLDNCCEGRWLEQQANGQQECISIHSSHLPLPSSCPPPRSETERLVEVKRWKRRKKRHRERGWRVREEREGVRGLCKGEGERRGAGRRGGGKEGGREGGEEVNLHILERAGFFIKKRLKLIYACALLTHCTL